VPELGVGLAERENSVPSHIVVVVAVPEIIGEMVISPGSPSKVVAVTVALAVALPLTCAEIVYMPEAGKVITVSVAEVPFTLKLAAGEEDQTTVVTAPPV
jgi:hypothetical protein